MNITKEMIEQKASETELYEDGYKGFISGAEWVLSLIEPTEANTNIMQAEASASAQGAAVGQRSVGTNAEALGCKNVHNFSIRRFGKCLKCGGTDRLREAPSGGHL